MGQSRVEIQKIREYAINTHTPFYHCLRFTNLYTSYNLKELFKGTILLNTNLSSLEYLESTQ